MLWPDFPARVAEWSKGQDSVWTDGLVSTHTAFISGPGRSKKAGKNYSSYGLLMMPPKTERCVYRVQSYGDADCVVGFSFVDPLPGHQDFTQQFTIIGDQKCNTAVAIPPISDGTKVVCFALLSKSTKLELSYLSVQRLVGKPPQYASSVS